MFSKSEDQSSHIVESDNDPIVRFKRHVDEYKGQADALRPILTACRDAAIRAYGDMDKEDRPDMMFNVNALNGVVSVIIMMMAKTLDVVPILIRELAKEGLRSGDKKFEDKKAFGIIDTREYQITDNVVLKVMLTGESCSLKQVGVKEVPVYEMECKQTGD